MSVTQNINNTTAGPIRTLLKKNTHTFQSSVIKDARKQGKQYQTWTEQAELSRLDENDLLFL